MRAGGEDEATYDLLDEGRSGSTLYCFPADQVCFPLLR